jgi:hypothetical protein
MFIRTEKIDGRTEQIMFDAEGPGAIVRFWMTFGGDHAGKGILRIYFDKQPIPAIEGKADDVLSGKLLTGEPLATSVSDSTKIEMRGHNLYLPLPYSSHCKVTYQSDYIKDSGAKTGGEAVYYNIDYRTYTSDVKAVSYSISELLKASTTIAIVQQLLKTRDSGLEKIPTETCDLSGTIAVGQSVSKTFSGSKAIRMIKLKLDPTINPQLLRTTVLEFIFDGERTVWCPIGDFFGTGYQLRYSNTWYSAVHPDGTLCVFWVMPFKQTAEIRIHNLGPQDITIKDGEIRSSTWKWDKNSMHFGTSWHQFTHLKTGKINTTLGTKEPFDINYVTLEGKGIYVGDAITLFNTAYTWWGEGDEKIYVNGETFPSFIGTGSEDYYGYAWCRPEKFANHPFIAQPDGSGNFWPGYTVNIRYRGLDGIPFNSSLKFDMEMWHWAKEATINHAPVTFWYLLPGGKSAVEPDTAGIKAPVALKRGDIVSPEITDEKIEGENMELDSISGGKFSFQESVEFGWSKHCQVFWNKGKKGDRLNLSFSSPDAIQTSVIAGLTCAPDYGEFSFRINGEKLPGKYNLYNKKVTVREINLGRHHLKKGTNRLIIEILNPGPNEGKAFFGIDYLFLAKEVRKN